MTIFICSDEDQTFFASILEAIRNEQTKEIWLGGSDIGSDGNFKWFDGAPILKTYWSTGYPNQPKSLLHFLCILNLKNCRYR